jgi:hypothetical protein
MNAASCCYHSGDRSFTEQFEVEGADLGPGELERTKGVIDTDFSFRPRFGPSGAEGWPVHVETLDRAFSLAQPRLWPLADHHRCANLGSTWGQKLCRLACHRRRQLCSLELRSDDRTWLQNTQI